VLKVRERDGFGGSEPKLAVKLRRLLEMAGDEHHAPVG
jgi:hypothetical protein